MKGLGVGNSAILAAHGIESLLHLPSVGENLQVHSLPGSYAEAYIKPP